MNKTIIRMDSDLHTESIDQQHEYIQFIDHRLCWIVIYESLINLTIYFSKSTKSYVIIGCMRYR